MTAYAGLAPAASSRIGPGHAAVRSCVNWQVRMSHSDEKYRALAAILKAMAHPSRLKMVGALEKRELSVGELQGLVGHDLSTVSRHLSLLRSAGLLESRRKGNQVFYRLRVPCVLQTFSCLDAVLREDARQARRLIARAS